MSPSMGVPPLLFPLSFNCFLLLNHGKGLELLHAERQRICIARQLSAATLLVRQTLKKIRLLVDHTSP